MSPIKIKEITIENFYECISLKLGEGQDRKIAPNVLSIAESKVNPCYTPYAIYLDEVVIGFVMTDYDPSLEPRNKYWVPRLMIDVRYQGKGYGKSAMKKIIDQLRTNEDCECIRLSTEPDNIVALRFYESIGFVNTGEVLDGTEIILELNLN
ncbi:GNAT family N-acetyltransferase [Fredinandcohnia onubensis]|uniref:GNAT family N-acetyltransferase n=1 Tax=Fredinandcohnia onubensis TaxID=1571209 RepID=UPI000C0BD091|nr:GNAT family N-acetyltransferase [Fredinandcohnia onubensis]